MTIRKTTSIAAIKVNTLGHAHLAHPNVVIIASPSRRTSLLQRQVSRALEIIDLYDHDETGDAATALASPRVRLAVPVPVPDAAKTDAAAARKSLPSVVFQISPAKRKRSASLSSRSGAVDVGLDLERLDAAATTTTTTHRATKTPTPSKRCGTKDKKKKRLKVDVVERALKRFHASRCMVDMEERCFDFTCLGSAQVMGVDQGRDEEEDKEHEHGHEDGDSDDSTSDDEHTVTTKPSANSLEALSTATRSTSSSRGRIDSSKSLSPCPSASSMTSHPRPMRVQVGVAAAQGTRAYMEDRFAVTTHLFEDRVDEELPRDASLFALYDGHNGVAAAELATDRFRELLGDDEYLLELCRRPSAAALTKDEVHHIEAILTDVFAKIDDEVLEETQAQHRRDGCTVLIGLLVLGKLFVANLGDSRGVMGSVDDATTVERLSVDHKPNLPEESARIEAMGGKVMFSGCWRVAHDGVPLRLAVSRSLGDHPLKTHLPSSCSGPLVSVVPSIRVVDVDQMDDSLMVFASDGLWDRLSDEDAIRIARTRVTTLEKPRGMENAMYDAAHALIDAALRKRSMDNITTMVIHFSPATKTLLEPEEEAVASDEASSEDDTSLMEL